MLSHAAIRWAFVLVRCTLEYCAVVAVEVEVEVVVAGVAGVKVVAGVAVVTGVAVG